MKQRRFGIAAGGVHLLFVLAAFHFYSEHGPLGNQATGSWRKQIVAEESTCKDVEVAFGRGYLIDEPKGNEQEKKTGS